MGQKWVVEQKGIDPSYIIVHLSLNKLPKWERWVFEAGGFIFLPYQHLPLATSGLQSQNSTCWRDHHENHCVFSYDFEAIYSQRPHVDLLYSTISHLLLFGFF